MAITHSSQIFNAQPAINSASMLDEVVSNLEMAKQCLLNAKSRCGADVFSTNEGNTFPSRIDKIIENLDIAKKTCESLKSNVVSRARDLHDSDYNEYQEYLRSLEEAESKDLKNNVKVERYAQ